MAAKSAAVVESVIESVSESLPVSGGRAWRCLVRPPAAAWIQTRGQSGCAIVDELHECLAGFARVVRQCQSPEPLELSRRTRGPDRIEEKAVGGLFRWQAHGLRLYESASALHAPHHCRYGEIPFAGFGGTSRWIGPRSRERGQRQSYLSPQSNATNA
jgi:hypothetical protein